MIQGCRKSVPRAKLRAAPGTHVLARAIGATDTSRVPACPVPWPGKRKRAASANAAVGLRVKKLPRSVSFPTRAKEALNLRSKQNFQKTRSVCSADDIAHPLEPISLLMCDEVMRFDESNAESRPRMDPAGKLDEIIELDEIQFLATSFLALTAKSPLFALLLCASPFGAYAARFRAVCGIADFLVFSWAVQAWTDTLLQPWPYSFAVLAI